MMDKNKLLGNFYVTRMFFIKIAKTLPPELGLMVCDFYIGDKDAILRSYYALKYREVRWQVKEFHMMQRMLERQTYGYDDVLGYGEGVCMIDYIIEAMGD